MKKKTAPVKIKKNKSELVIVILASACVILALAIGLLSQQKDQLNNQNYQLEQTFLQQNVQLQTLQDKVKMMEAAATPTPSY